MSAIFNGIKNIIRPLIPRALLSIYHLTLAHLADFLYGSPSKKLIVVGVTGTKGKSTTVNLISQLLELNHARTGLTSTINFKVADRTWLNNKKMTMLGRFATHKLLREMVQKGCTHAIIETSSEGIAQSRHRGIHYDVAVFTNLTPEHIESHGSFEAYRDAKERFFEYLTQTKHKTIKGVSIPKIIVANRDDGESERILRFTADSTKTFGEDAEADVKIAEKRLTSVGSHFNINDVQTELKLLGDFNIMNAAAAVAVVLSLGYDENTVLHQLQKLRPLPGRQEWIHEGQNFKIMIDYAYETQSQEKLYEMLALVKKVKLIHVTGSAGGGRDKRRRHALGTLAAKNADIVIVTNEDPYDEDPEQIIQEVAAGAEEVGKKRNTSLFTISDRRDAIAKALALAQQDDLVLLTGKGSEQAICVANGKKIPWDDRRVVRELLKASNSKHTYG